MSPCEQMPATKSWGATEGGEILGKDCSTSKTPPYDPASGRRRGSRAVMCTGCQPLPGQPWSVQVHTGFGGVFSSSAQWCWGRGLGHPEPNCGLVERLRVYGPMQNFCAIVCWPWLAAPATPEASSSGSVAQCVRADSPGHSPCVWCWVADCPPPGKSYSKEK